MERSPLLADKVHLTLKRWRFYLLLPGTLSLLRPRYRVQSLGTSWSCITALRRRRRRRRGRRRSCFKWENGEEEESDGLLPEAEKLNELTPLRTCVPTSCWGFFRSRQGNFFFFFSLSTRPTFWILIGHWIWYKIPKKAIFYMKWFCTFFCWFWFFRFIQGGVFSHTGCGAIGENVY